MRIFIFDPCFGNMTGHWENYCKRFYHALEALGHQVFVFGQFKPEAEIIASVNFKPLFQHSPFVEMRTVADYKTQTKLFLQDLEQVKTEQFADTDLLIFHSIFPTFLAALVAWSEKLLQSKSIKIALFFQFPLGSSKQHTSLIRRWYCRAKQFLRGESTIKDLDWLQNLNVSFTGSFAKRIQSLVAKGQCYLYASTEVLSKNYTVLLNAHVENLPMPGPIHKLEETIQITTEISIGYFGHSSLEKGGQFLESLVQQTRKFYPQVKFILHLNPNRETTSYLKRIAEMKEPQVECYQGHLSQEKILSLMKQANVILLPYSITKYANTPSAIFCEAMPLKKVFVLPDQTWVQQEAQRYQTGYTVFTEYNAENILNALLQAIKNFQNLQQQSVRAAARYYAENNIENYTQQFIQSLQFNSNDSGQLTPSKETI